MDDKKRIVSTVIIGIFAIISLICVIYLFPINLRQTIDSFNNSVKDNNNAQEAVGAIVVAGASSIVLVLIILLAYALAIIPIINSSICVIFSIKNRKAYLKPIRIINYVYDGLFAFMFVFCVIKLILFATGVA